jgi:hypothetical protein
MSADDQLLYESRVKPRQAVIAGLAAVLLLLGAVLQLLGPHTKVDELTADLITANKRFPLDLIAAVIAGLGSLALAWTLAFLFDMTRARNPEQRTYVRMIALAGGVLAAVGGVAYSAVISIKVHQFVTHGSQTYDQANHLTSTGLLLALQLIVQAAALMLALSFVLVSLNAMRVGLLTRFMGYLGIFAGVLVLFQITQIPVVQAYWLVAFIALLLGRWPSGNPPSWRTGKAEPWPSSQQQRAKRAGLATGKGRPAPASTPAPQALGASGASNARARSGAAKRKRKRRR